MTIFQKEVTTYHYISLAESVRQNGYRHEFRGYNWLELGYDDRAKRSFEKACKFLKRADMLEPKGILYYLGMIDLMQNKMANSIINGTK